MSLVLAIGVAGAAAAAQGLRDEGPGAKPEPAWRRVLRGDDARRVEALEERINELEKKGQFVEALALAREVLAIRHRVQGEDHWETVDARIEEQTCAQVAGLPPKQQSDLAAALRQQEEVEEHFQRGRYAKAEPLLRGIATVYQRVLGEDHPLTVRSSSDLGVNLDHQGKHTEAEALHRKAVRIRARMLGEDHPQTAESANNLGLSLSDQGKCTEAEPWLRKAWVIWSSTLGEDHPQMAVSSNNLAYNLDEQGRYTEAQPLLRKVLAIRVRTLGEDHPLTARSYNNLAYNLNGQGRYAEAQVLDWKALAIRIRTLGPDHPLTARSYNNLATDLQDQGRYTEAEPLLQKALAIYHKTWDEDHPDTAQSLNNLATNLDDQGKHTEAEPLHRQALAMRRRILGADHPDTVQSLNNLATNLDDQGKHAEAEPLFREALDIHRKSAANHPLTGLSDRNRAANLNVQGKYAEAEPFCRQAVEIGRRALGEEHPYTVSSYEIWATNLNARGRYAEAEAMALAATRSYEVARLRVGFAGLDRAEFASSRSPLPLLAAIRARRGCNSEAWEHWEAGLARGLVDDLAARRNRPLTLDERRRQEALIRQLNRVDNQIGALAATQTLTSELVKRLAELKDQRLELQGRLVQLEAELVRNYPAAGDTVDPLDQIRAQLPADSALVGWLDLGTMPRAADPRGDHWACVVRRTGAPRWIRIPGTGPDQAWTPEDNRRPGQVRGLLGNPDRPEWRQPLAELAQERVAPLEAALAAGDDLPAVRHLIVLPSPALAGIPVEALLEARPPEAPRYLVSYAPSGTLFARLQERREEERGSRAQPRRLLALGDPSPPPLDEPSGPATRLPDHGLLVQQVAPGSNAERAGIRPGDVLLRYAGAKLATPADLQKPIQAGDPQTTSVASSIWRNGQSLDLTLAPGPLGIALNPRAAAEAIRAGREAVAWLRRTRGESFDPLPGSRREVQAIAGLFESRAVYLGSEASEPILDELRNRGELATFTVIHLATHGRVDDLAPMRSRLLLAQDRLPDPTTLASLDQPVSDGILTASEVLGTWKLQAELVTLSACRSGLGRQSGGEGYLGFAQAFFLAGSRSLLVSLWEVDDRATSLLMTRFYQNWLGRRTGLDQPLAKAEALREAKAWLRNLTGAEAERALDSISRGEIRSPSARAPVGRPFAHPHDWAGFILMGNPV